MDNELLRALNEFDELIKSWNSGKTAKEEDFLQDVKLINGRVALLLSQPEKPSRQMRIE